LICFFDSFAFGCRGGTNTYQNVSKISRIKKGWQTLHIKKYSKFLQRRTKNLKISKNIKKHQSLKVSKNIQA